jgi:hypothetical protein
MQEASYLLIFCLVLQAQNPAGRIGGRVTDTSGAVVAGAVVRAVNLETGLTASTKTNAEGLFEVPNLNPGQYRVEAEMAGFKQHRRGPLELRVGDVLSLTLPLEVGSASEAITVVADTPLLESANADVGQVIDNRRIEDLPLPGGSVMYLMQLVPGVVSTNPPTHGWFPMALDAISNMGATGTRARGSEFTLDGIPNMTRGGMLSFSPPPGMVQEFRVQTAPFDASAGHFSGALVNMALKSGANLWHGSAYWMHLVPSWATHDFFTNRFIYDTRTGPVTPEKIDSAWPTPITNRYWFTGSGPVRIPRLYDGRNRTFFMYGFDLLDRNRPERGNPFTVPTAEQRNGDFSKLLALGGQYQIYDPYTTVPDTQAGRFRRQPFAGNIIPRSRIDPAGAKFVSYYPQPNAVGTADGLNNYSDPRPAPVDYHAQMVRFDHAVNDNNRLNSSLTWTYNYETHNTAFHNETLGYQRSRQQRGFSLGDVAMLRPDLVLDLRFGFTRFILFDRSVSIGYDLAQLGLNQALVSRIDRAYASFPEVDVTGYSGFTDTQATKPITNYYTVSAGVTRPRGSHGLRFGGEFRILQENGYSWGSTSPKYTFGTTWTQGPLDNSAASPIGQGLAAMLLGLPTAGYIDRNSPYSEQSKYAALYLQDDWKITRRLTLNLGLRYDLELPSTERYNRATAGFDFTTASPIAAQARANYARSPLAELPLDRFNPRGGLLFAGVNGAPRGLWRTDRNNFAPRAGLAWLIGSNTVLRAGYGIFWDTIGTDRTDVIQQGFNQRTNLVSSLDNGRTYRASIVNPFPDGFQEPSGASAGLATFLGRAPSFSSYDRQPAYMQRWTFNLERVLPHRVLVVLGYIGNRGTGMGLAEEYDGVPAEYLSRLPVRDTAANNRLTRAVANPFFGMPEFAGSGIPGATVQAQQLLRPMPQFTSVSTTSSRGFSWYHSLQLRVERRMANGFTIQGSYTWSKFMEAIEKLNSTDPVAHHVVSPQDRPQRVAISGVYELPFGRGRRWMQAGGWRNAAFGGWQAQGVYQGQSGPPIGFGNIFYYGSSLGGIVLPRPERTVERWFNTDAGFERDSRLQPVVNIRAFPLRLTGLRADGYNHFDLSLFKSWRIGERLAVQFRADAQDAVNHAMFAAPNINPAATAFGQVSAIVATEQRRINLGCRVNF